jgi:hypothetical protein
MRTRGPDIIVYDIFVRARLSSRARTRCRSAGHRTGNFNSLLLLKCEQTWAVRQQAVVAAGAGILSLVKEL